jgi:hypothetical protein
MVHAELIVITCRVSLVVTERKVMRHALSHDSLGRITGFKDIQSHAVMTENNDRSGTLARSPALRTANCTVSSTIRCFVKTFEQISFAVIAYFGEILRILWYKYIFEIFRKIQTSRLTHAGNYLLILMVLHTVPTSFINGLL